MINSNPNWFSEHREQALRRSQEARKKKDNELFSKTFVSTFKTNLTAEHITRVISRGNGSDDSGGLGSRTNEFCFNEDNVSDVQC